MLDVSFDYWSKHFWLIVSRKTTKVRVDHPPYQYSSFLLIVGMKFTELYEQCKRSFYVNNEQNLRLQLIEFIDHRLIKLGKSTNDGQEIVRLLLAERDLVKQLLDKLH